MTKYNFFCPNKPWSYQNKSAGVSAYTSADYTVSQTFGAYLYDDCFIVLSCNFYSKLSKEKLIIFLSSPVLVEICA